MTANNARPVVFVSDPSVTNGASDTSNTRGAWDTPYATLEKALTELTGSGGPFLSPGTPVELLIYPGPRVSLLGGYTPGATISGGQCQLLTQKWILPDNVTIRSLGSGNPIPPSGITKGSSASIIYGNVSGDALLQFGSASSSSVGAGLVGITIVNTAATGDGVAVLGDINGARCENVWAWACGRNGFITTKHSADDFQFLRCGASYCGYNNGGTPSGYGFQLGPGGTGAPNLVIADSCQFMNNYTTSYGSYGASNQGAGEILVWNDDSVGTSGLACTFRNCDAGNNGILLLGSKAILFDGGHITGDGSHGEAIRIDQLVNGGTTSMPRGIEIRNVYFDGFGGVPSGTGRHVNALNARAVRVVNNYHVGSQPDTTDPYVYFADNVKYSRADILVGLKNDFTVADSNHSGPGNRYCRIGPSTGLTNYGLYFDTVSNVVAQYGSVL